MASMVGISVGSFHSILRDGLNVHHICEHVVSRMLTPEQKETGTHISGDVISMAD